MGVLSIDSHVLPFAWLRSPHECNEWFVINIFNIPTEYIKYDVCKYGVNAFRQAHRRSPAIATQTSRLVLHVVPRHCIGTTTIESNLQTLTRKTAHQELLKETAGITRCLLLRLPAGSTTSTSHLIPKLKGSKSVSSHWDTSLTHPQSAYSTANIKRRHSPTQSLWLTFRTKPILSSLQIRDNPYLPGIFWLLQLFHVFRDISLDNSSGRKEPRLFIEFMATR